MKAPFPWFGGKSTVANAVWRRLGSPKQYIEPFCGSAAILLAAPTPASLEVIGDANCYVANFWRALKLQPDAVIAAQDYPVSHIDLFARHRWLTDPARVATLRDALLDPEWPGDAKIAGWWLWGQCAWIGDGWCAGPVANGESLGKIPATTSGHGVSALSLGPAAARDVRAWLDALSARLSRVRVLHGDWRRCLGMSANYDAGDVAVFLDPPYEGFEALYSESAITAQAAAAWARENEGSRIALCGHIGDYEMPGWSVMEWSRLRTSFGSAKTKDAECIWFSPGCLPDAPVQMSLLGGAA